MQELVKIQGNQRVFQFVCQMQLLFNTYDTGSLHKKYHGLAIASALLDISTVPSLVTTPTLVVSPTK